MTDPLNPLLNTWHAVADRRHADVAVVDTASGQSWSFAALRDEALKAARDGTSSPRHTRAACPQDAGISFLISLLAAWENDQVVCPLEAASPLPAPELWTGLTEKFPEAVLAKTTSGSTGTPRRILFSGAQLAADAQSIVTTMGLDPDFPNVGCLSLAHSYGFSNLVLPLLLHGIPLVLAASPLPESLRAALAHVEKGVAGGTRATLPGVPALWRAWHAAGVLDADRVSVAVSAGAALPLDLERRVWADTGVKIHNFLGSSECGGIAYDRTLTPRDESTCVGTPLDGVHLSANAEGRLVVSSAAVGLGYWPPHALAEEPGESTLQPGVFVTGDLAESRNGQWHVIGRAVDTINLAGRKLHPAEIEAVLRTHPSITECLVFGIPSANAARGEEIVATVAMNARDSGDWNTLPAWLGARLPSWKLPRHWWHRPDLGPTERGKLPRALWRERFLAERPR